MQISIEKLRRWLLFAALVLAGVIAAYLGVARYQQGRAPANDVKPLPTGIQQQTNGFTYSKSNQGRTLFTIHAARAVQLQQSGQAELYDVRIILYGRTPGREDRIAGHEFHYDQNTGVATAKGEVHLDLQAPAQLPGAAQEMDEDPAAMSGKGADKGIIHVKTQGIVFLQSLQVAATDQPLEFAFNGIVGHAKGAEFDSDRDLVTLQSAVDARILLHGKPVNITATHAVLDHVSGESNLTHVEAHTEGQTGHADNVTIHTRKDGSVDHIDATGNVSMSSDTYGDITAPLVHLWMDAKSQPLRASASGGVHYTDKQAALERTGEASDGDVLFGEKGMLRQAHLNGNVKMQERAPMVQTTGKRQPMLERNLAASHLTLGFIPDTAKSAHVKKSHSVLQTVHAEGAARFTMQQPAALKNNPNGIATREISGDVLDGDLSDNNGKRYFSHIQGSGHTRLVQTAADNSVDTSTGDTINIAMRPQAGTARKQQSSSQQMDIVSAVQTGHVQLSQVATVAAIKPGEKASQPSVTTGLADRAEYTGANQHLVLTGMPQVTDSGTTLWAQRITLDQPTGNVMAEGTVKANYFEQNADPSHPSEPVHVIADHAQLQHTQQRAIFYGRPGSDARIWQQSSQVSAPVLDLVHSTQTLTAHGDNSATAEPVHAAFPANSTGGTNSGTKTNAGGTARVASHQMVYSGITRTAVFTGGVDFLSAETRTRSRQATVWFQNSQPGAKDKSTAPKPTAQPAQQSGLFGGGSVQKVLAEGNVLIDQPARHGTGESLLYTTEDGHYLLTGTPAAPPKLVDDVKGTISGASLLFKSNDDEVIISGASGYNRPHIETHAHSK